MQLRVGIVVLLVFCTSCHFFKKDVDRKPIARVNDTYLYFDEVKGLLTQSLSSEDSTLLVQNYIENWAKEQLFVQGAKLNLSEKEQQDFDKLVQQYKNDLYSKSYIEALVSRSVNTDVSIEEAQEYYEANKDVFKLNEELIKFRYINVSEKILDFNEIEKKFKRFNEADKRELDSIAIQFKSYSLNDSIWIRLSQAVDKIPVITAENKGELLKKTNFIELKDSLGVYLMKINDVLLRNDTAPLEYVKPTIDQIVINKRKLELIRELEKDIIKDAIKNKQFETFK
ncbi:hypothetical protein [Gaetbulibacter saemankumensis]|uniref:hypothetical protein n=1 Tax=Gaetbulibacter saemankumensis TaxID=311208 RepID=UPI00048196A6|nr:hypothetical protein [Gaetbulibacter saemankumensis]